MMNSRCRWLRAGWFLSAWACLVVHAEMPLLLGRVEIPAMMVSAQRLSSLMEKSSPGSSAPVGLGIAALAFNPQLRYFDLTQPIVLFLYVYPEELGGGTQWCFSMGKKEKEIPDILPDGNTPVYVKDVGDRCFVSRVPGLADIAAMGDLPSVAEAEDRDVAITLWPATGLERNEDLMQQLRGEGARLLFQRGGTSPDTMAAARMYHLRFGLLERFLRQARETTISVHFSEASLDFNGTVTPSPESELEQFCGLQVDGGTDPVMMSLPEQAGWSGAVHLVATPVLRQGIVGFLRDLAMESADQADPEYFAAITAILDAWTGQGRFCEVPGTGDKSTYLDYLDVGTDRKQPVLASLGGVADGDEQSLFLNQYPDHEDLQFRVYESASGMALVQHADSDAAARAALAAAKGMPAVETPLCRGEMLFRQHFEMMAAPAATGTDKDTPEEQPATEKTAEAGKLYPVEYSCKIEQKMIRYRCSIPAELLEKINPKNLFPTQPSPSRR